MKRDTPITTYKKALKSLLSLLLLSAFLFPSAIQFAHAFDVHEHSSCEEVNLHIHETITDCSICDFNFVPFEFQALVYSGDTILPVTCEPATYFFNFFYNPFQKTNTQLRAPPYFLV